MTPGSASGVTALCATCADTMLATKSSKSGLDGTACILGDSTWDRSLQTAAVGSQPDAPQCLLTAARPRKGFVPVRTAARVPGDADQIRTAPALSDALA